MLPSFVISQTAGSNRLFDLLSGSAAWVMFGLIVLAFVVFGVRDLARLSWVRLSAISSVSFDESIRRRVLWVTPLAILGAVIVSQLQNPVDPQDDIRQTTKICLFATGLVVTLVAIILASTNLQKEIETRVIYTIVTKPTTRLEIVLGKVWGFAKVSAAILLIMGVFTYAYLHFRAWQLGKHIATTLESIQPSDPRYDTFKHYQDAGLLNAKAMTLPASLQLLSRPPVDNEPVWMAGGQGQKYAVTFNLADNELKTVEEAVKSGGRVELRIKTSLTARDPNPQELEVIRQTNIPLKAEPTSQPATAPATAEQNPGRPVPTLGIQFQTLKHELVVPVESINRGLPLPVPEDGAKPAVLPLAGDLLIKLFEVGTFQVLIDAKSPAVEYSVPENPVTIEILRGDGSTAGTINATEDSRRPKVQGSLGRYGVQLIGGKVGEGGVAAYRFNDGIPAGSTEGDQLTFEIKAGIERGGDYSGDVEILPRATLTIVNAATGEASQPVEFRPETNRISYVAVPRSAVPTNAPFNTVIRVLTSDQWLGVDEQSVALATASRSFAFNLFKSLLILWLLSILVVSIALFCSTFVSWPIAVVLTLVLLLGHWGVEQIGDVGSGLGATLTGQTQDAVQARIMRTGIDALGKTLTVVAAVLPDISRFQATADIERGISVPLSRLGSAGWVLLGYGLPMVALAYLILKRKEVAP